MDRSRFGPTRISPVEYGEDIPFTIENYAYRDSFGRETEVCEWYDDEAQKFRIQVEVTNRTWGRLFGYRGSFDATCQKVEEDGIPDHVRPMREERRE